MVAPRHIFKFYITIRGKSNAFNGYFLQIYEMLKALLYIAP